MTNFRIHHFIFIYLHCESFRSTKEFNSNLISGVQKYFHISIFRVAFVISQHSAHVYAHISISVERYANKKQRENNLGYSAFTDVFD